jgi:hypothetical protein
MPTINKLPLLGTPSGGDQLPVYAPNSGDARRMSITALTDYMQDTLDLPDNSDEVSFLQSGTGAVTRTVQSKLRDVVSVKDFGAVGDGATDDTTAIAAALVAATGKALYFPASSSFYRITNTLTIPADTMVYGDGYGSAIRQTTRERNVFAAGNNCTIQNLRLRGDGVTSGGVDFTKNNGVVIIGARNVKVQECFLHGFEFNGVYCNNSTNVDITGNYIWGNAYSNSSSADIVLYGTSGASRRINITKNFCFSNNSQGIYVDAIGVDSDVLVEGNICVTLDASTWVEIAPASLLRRHGVIVGYNGTSGRYVVSGNICRNTRETGIYYQGGVASGDGVQIIGNQCTSNGINALEPALAAGIYVATQGDGDIIANNLIEDFSESLEFSACGIRVSPAAASAISAFAHTMVSNNVIRASAGHGIVLSGYAVNCEVHGNIITGSTRSDIGWFPIAAVATVGGHTIKNNKIERATTARPGIELDFQASTLPLYVTNNFLLGEDYTVNSANNVGVKWAGNPPIYVLDNQIRNFYHGVYQSNYLTGRAFSQQFIDRNVFNLCTNGIMVAGTTTAPVLPVQDNVFISCVTKASGAALGSDVVYIAQRFGDKIYFQAASVPTVGTWAIGDRAQQATPVVGQPKGWFCTVSGTPGTWVSEGNL